MSTPRQLRLVAPAERVTAPTLSDPDVRVERRPPPERSLGRYRILRELGRGGMGVVLEAHDPLLDRRVALKLLDGERGDQAAARQLREAQALARLTHPNVVAVYEAGTIDGHGFIAMELVEGQSLRQWHRDPRPWRALLDAYLQAGRGLAAAHDQGLVHRDFKPSNCLIDASGRVRVADFGLAEDVGRRDRSRGEPEAEPPPAAPRSADAPRPFDEPLTRLGAVVGTLAYMPPEQRQGMPWDARGDQYSFCASFWEALHGEAPPAPTSTIGTPPDRRPSGPRALRRALRRGMAADPAQRWPSMHALLRALERCRRASTRRRWLLALLGTNVAIAAAVWSVEPAAEPPCRRAHERLHGVWDEERARAVDAAFRATGRVFAEHTSATVRARLDDYAAAWVDAHTQACEAAHVHGELSPAGLDQRMTCLESRRTALAHAVEQLVGADAEIVEQAVRVVAGLPAASRCADPQVPAIEPPPAELADAVTTVREQLDRGRTHLAAGKYDEGLALCEAATTRALALGYEPVLAEARLVLGELHLASGHYREAADELRAAHAMALRHDHAEVAAEAAASLVFVVGVALAQPEAAAFMGDAALALAQRVDAGGPREAEAVLGVAQVLAKHGDDGEAEARFTQALELLHAAPQVDPLVRVGALDGLRGVLRRQGRHAEAERLAREAVTLVEQQLGPEHPAMVHRLANLAAVLVDEGQHTAAEEQLRRALEIGRASLAPEHPALAHVHGNLGAVLLYRGRHDEARVELEQALVGWQRALSPEHDMVADVLVNLGVVARGQGRLDLAERHYRDALAQYAAIYSDDHPKLAMVELNLGKTLQALGRPVEAAERLERARAAFERHGGADHPDLGKALDALGLLEYQQGNYARAQEHQRRALEILERAHPGEPTHPRVARAWWALGRTELRLGRVEPARERLERALAAQTSADVRPVDRAQTELTLAELRWLDPATRAEAVASARRALERVSQERGDAAERVRAELQHWLDTHR